MGVRRVLRAAWEVLRCRVREKVRTDGVRQVDRAGMILQVLKGLESHCEDFGLY